MGIATDLAREFSTPCQYESRNFKSESHKSQFTPTAYVTPQ